MKRQSKANAAFKERHGLARFSCDITAAERQACYKSAYPYPAIVRAGMQALGISQDNSISNSLDNNDKWK